MCVAHMDFKSFNQFFSWMLVCSFVSYLASRCAFSDRLPLGQYQAECCLKVENLSAKPVSEWSLQDWEELTNATKCCDMSDRYRLSACSAVASARENPQIEPKAVEPSDCCMLLDALMRRPHAEWTFRERLHYRKWNECCAEHMVYEQSIHKHVKEGSGDDCCKSFEALNCTSAEDLSAEERGRLNAGVNCCLNKLPFSEMSLTNKFISRSPCGRCQQLKDLFFSSTEQANVDDEGFSRSKARRNLCGPRHGCTSGHEYCCTGTKRDEVDDASYERRIRSSCCRLVEIMWHDVGEDLSPNEKASVLFYSRCCQGSLKNQQVIYTDKASNTVANSSN
ncbi:hypothetical protein MPTK1_2g21970 [Marchantia polymorpha subsp. ruderalis]|uniref:Uncharacterized protein n=1 Tax=Marchantia polymorpha TaxID=3197 RepID=A0A2R6X2J6_MARPO|nr:hypothetical protein MARPO_0040s0018 [Marchantia polymorpha]BBN03244.1 hypothetical protein Mp_2g21970 [Marchantia polymorpha subsp. ruderalis]|eukprot:PTQ40333.1 hypothetical protein MARPO_0040s0018 [Marchantia polymorpha]